MVIILSKFETYQLSFKNASFCRWSRVTFYSLIVGALVVFLVLDTADERERLISFVGLLSLILFGWIFSRSPSKVSQDDISNSKIAAG